MSYDFSEDELLMHELCHKKMQLSDFSFQNFLNVDSNICAVGILDDAIISNLINENEMELSDQEEEKEITPTLILN